LGLVVDLSAVGLCVRGAVGDPERRVLPRMHNAFGWQ